LLLSSSLYGADPPAVHVLGPSLTAPAADAAIPLPAGRFLAISPASGLPVYIADDRGYRCYLIKSGGQFTGIKWDAAADAEPEAYSWPEAKGPVYVILARGYVGTYTIQPVRNGKTAADPPERDGSALRIQILAAPRPPPTPDPPIDPPLPVTKSFRVIFVVESGVTLSAVQTAVASAKAVRDYCTAKTTPEGGLAGWRQYDPQVNTTNEHPNMKALWAAVKPKMTTVPCLVVEKDGKAEILPYPANAAEALTTLQTYGGK
jgi:hypothetical protein